MSYPSWKTLPSQKRHWRYAFHFSHSTFISGENIKNARCALINKNPPFFQATRLGKHVNELRRKAQDRYLASRAKNLVKKWRQLLVTPAGGAGTAAPTSAVSSVPVQDAGAASGGGVNVRTASSRISSPALPSQTAPTTTNHRQPQPPPHVHTVLKSSRKLPGSSLPSSTSTSPESRPNSPYNDTAGVGRTHASNKRLRKADNSEYAGSNNVSRSSSPPPPPSKRQKLINGGGISVDSMDETTRDSVLSTGSNSNFNCDTTGQNSNLHPAEIGKRHNGHNISPSHKANNNSRRKTRSQKNPAADVLEQQMLSVISSGGKKVRTTREIVEELAARSHSPGLVSRTAAAAGPPNNSSSSVASGAPETQSELMSRFFRSQNGVTTTSPPLSGSQPHSPPAGRGGMALGTEVSSLLSTAPNSGTATPMLNDRSAADDPVSDAISEVMSRLPVISSSEVLALMKEEEAGEDDEDEVEDEDGLEVEGLIPMKKVRAVPELEVTEDLVDRLHEDPMESFNGNFDHRGEFREWNEVVSKETTEGDLLYVLPYSVIE
jgi:hypothetical protein